MKNTMQHFCSICGKNIHFVCETDISLRESTCPNCGSSRRTVDLAKIICDTFLPGSIEPLRIASANLAHLSIFETQSTGVIHDALSGLPDYICSEYFDNVDHGHKNSQGILCQDLQNLTFPSDKFDLVFSQDVFEHVQQTERALLKYGVY